MAQLVLCCVLFLCLCVSIHFSKKIPSIFVCHYFIYVGDIFHFLHVSINLSAFASTVLQLQAITLSKHIHICVCVCVCVLRGGGSCLKARQHRWLYASFQGIKRLYELWAFPSTEATCMTSNLGKVGKKNKRLCPDRSVAPCCNLIFYHISMNIQYVLK